MHLLIDAVQVDEEVGVGISPAVDVEEVLGAVRLGLQEVVEREPELVGQLTHGGVALVDELAAVLRDLAVGKAADRPAAAADSFWIRLVDRGVVPGLMQPVGARQAGEPCADDGDLRLPGGICRLREAAHRARPCDRSSRGRGPSDQLASSRPTLDDLCIRVLDALRQRCSRHSTPPRMVWEGSIQHSHCEFK